MGEPKGKLVTPVADNPDDELRSLEVDANDNLKVTVESLADKDRRMYGYCPETTAWHYIRVNNVGEIVIDPIDTEKIADRAVTPAKMKLEWTDWTPTYSASGSMTYTSVTTYVAKYIVIDKICRFQLSCVGTIGGTLSLAIYITLPVACADSTGGYVGGGCNVVDEFVMSGFWYNINADSIRVHKYNSSNFHSGAGQVIRMQGFYRVA